MKKAEKLENGYLFFCFDTTALTEKERTVVNFHSIYFLFHQNPNETILC